MGKGGIFISFLILITSLSLINAEIDNDKIDSKVIDAIEQNGSANVIIVADKNANVEDDLKDAEKLAHSEVIAANISRDEMVMLMKDSDVREVIKERVFKIMLQDSIGLINASYTWQKIDNGANLTGSNVSICVLDTGVNYTHQNLGGCLGAACKVRGGWDFVNNDNDPMDDHGHGTHVAGIAASNGSIKGAAPDANIIAIKVLNSAGSGSDANIIKGIGWCVGNASAYNIKVISMSLGTDCDLTPEYCYSSFCNDDPLASAINNATAAGIAVVAASGNDNNYTAIPTPACVQNATAIAASTKADEMASYSNRNSLVSIIAPGSSINSTAIGGNFETRSGTSMAAPHAAGAIAIMWQFLQGNGLTRTTEQIKTSLNSTGKAIYDSLSNRNYARINIFSVLVNIDEVAPNTSLQSPADEFLTLESNITFRCNATDLSLKNATLFVWNSTSLYNQTTYPMSGQNAEFGLNMSNISGGNYYWNCFWSDEHGNLAYGSNYSFSINAISVNLISPVNNNYSSLNAINFSCRAETERTSRLSNLTFSLWNSSGLAYNKTTNLNGTSNSTSFNYTFSNEGLYLWNCFGVNNISNSSFASANYSFSYDATKPAVTLQSPADGYSNSGTTSASFVFNAADNQNISNCSLILNNVIANTTNAINGSNTIAYSLTTGNYNWSINCSDKAGNYENSSTRSISITAPVSISSTNNGGSSGGSGGGGASIAAPQSQTYSAVLDDKTGYTKSTAKGDLIKISGSIIGEHNLTITSVSADEASFVLRSEPMSFSLKVGEIKKFNLTNADYYDLSMKLEGITNGKANVTIKETWELINKYFASGDKNSSSSDKAHFGLAEGLPAFTYLIIAFAIFLLGFFISWAVFHKRRKAHEKRKEIARKIKGRWMK